MRGVVALFRMTRPAQLLLVTIVGAVGASMAIATGHHVDGGAAVLAGVALIACWASLHLTNEWVDSEVDRLISVAGTRTRFSGGSVAIPGEDVPRSWPAIGAVIFGVVGIGLTLIAWGVGALPDVGVWLQGVTLVLGYAYSLPPFKLAWRGLGEIANAAVGGLVLPLYGYAAVAGTLMSLAALAFVPFGCLVFANLIATQWPDRLPDAAVGKRSLAVRLSPSALQQLYLLSAAGAYAVALGLTGLIPNLVVRATLLGVPFSVLGAATITRWHSPFPAVAAMVIVAIAQLLAWSAVGGVLPT